MRWEVHSLGGESRIWWAETGPGDQGLEEGLQEALRLVRRIPGHLWTPDPLDPIPRVKPVMGPFSFQKEGGPLPREWRGHGCPGWNGYPYPVFSILSVASPLCLSQSVPQKVLCLLLVQTPCSNYFANPPALENAQSSGVRCQPGVGVSSLTAPFAKRVQ